VLDKDRIHLTRFGHRMIRGSRVGSGALIEGDERDKNTKPTSKHDRESSPGRKVRKGWRMPVPFIERHSEGPPGFGRCSFRFSSGSRRLRSPAKWQFSERGDPGPRWRNVSRRTFSVVASAHGH
jgi:hypothetical protein